MIHSYDWPLIIQIIGIENLLTTTCTSKMFCFVFWAFQFIEGLILLPQFLDWFGTCLLVGAADMGRRVKTSSSSTEKLWRTPTATRAGVGRARNWYFGKRAQYNHPPAVPGKAPCKKTHGQIQEKSAQVERWQSYQSSLWCV